MAPPTYSLAESARRTRRTMPPMAATAAQAWKTPRRRGRGVVRATASPLTGRSRHSERIDVRTRAGVSPRRNLGWGKRCTSDPRRLDVQAGLVVVALDEVLARGHFLAHELREHAVGGHRVLYVDLEHDTTGGIHGRLPELLGVHLTQTLVALDVRLAVLEAAGVGVLLLVGIYPAELLALLDAVQRRLGDVQVTAFDELGHVAGEGGG